MNVSVGVKRLSEAIVLGSALALLEGVGAPPAGAAPGEASLQVGQMFAQTVPAQLYVFETIETDFQNMGPPIIRALAEMGQAALDKKIGLHGAVVVYYYGAPHRSPMSIESHCE